MNVFRGDIFVIKGESPCIDLKGGRPGIVVSNNMGNQYSKYVEVVFLTTREKKPLPTHCEIICRQKTTALCEQVCTVPKDNLCEFIKTCTPSEMQRIDDALKMSLGIQDALRTSPGMQNEPIRKDETAAEESIEEVKVERNLYKRLYEQLLDKITG